MSADHLAGRRGGILRAVRQGDLLRPAEVLREEALPAVTEVLRHQRVPQEVEVLRHQKDLQAAGLQAGGVPRTTALRDGIPAPRKAAYHRAVRAALRVKVRKVRRSAKRNRRIRVNRIEKKKGLPRSAAALRAIRLSDGIPVLREEADLLTGVRLRGTEIHRIEILQGATGILRAAVFHRVARFIHRRYKVNRYLLPLQKRRQPLYKAKYRVSKIKILRFLHRKIPQSLIGAKGRLL